MCSSGFRLIPCITAIGYSFPITLFDFTIEETKFAMAFTYADLINFAEILERRAEITDVRQLTYLRTYPVLKNLGNNESGDLEQDFTALAAAVYGWMPRILRINCKEYENAIEKFGEARGLTNATPKQIANIVDVMASCLFSVVGASKLLHFTNDQIFPIWDSRVAEVWSDVSPSYYHMSKTKNYLKYAEEVAELTKAKKFSIAYDRIQRAHSENLCHHGIRRYEISPIRSVEMAAFYRSGAGYDDV